MFNSSFCLALYLCIRCPRKIFLRLRVKPRLVAVGDEFAEHPFPNLSLRALLRLAKRDAESLQLRLIERIGQVIKQVLRTSPLCLAYRVCLLIQQIRKDLHLAP